MFDIQKNLIYNIKFHRKRLHITQEKLANLLNVSPNYIGRIEIGYNFPSVEILNKLSKIFKIKPYMLFLDKEEELIISKNDKKLKRKILINSLIKEIEISIKKVLLE